MSTSREALMSPTGLAFASDDDLMIHINYGLFVKIVTLFQCYRLQKKSCEDFLFGGLLPQSISLFAFVVPVTVL